MKQLYFHMFDVIMLFYISLSSWPNINTLCTVVDRERLSVFTVDHWVQKSGHVCPIPFFVTPSHASVLERIFVWYFGTTNSRVKLLWYIKIDITLFVVYNLWKFFSLSGVWVHTSETSVENSTTKIYKPHLLLQFPHITVLLTRSLTL